MMRLDQKGQGLTEYLMLMILISVISIGVTKALGNTIKTKIKEAQNHINKEVTLQE